MRSGKWTGEERRELTVRLATRAEIAVRVGDVDKVLDCLLCIRMVCTREAENLELNKGQFEKALADEKE